MRHAGQVKTAAEGTRPPVCPGNPVSDTRRGENTRPSCGG